MAWYNPGGGAGVWDAAKVDTDLRNIIAQLCHAVNERELYRSAARVAITSITRALAVATVTTTASHSLTTGHYVFIIGAEQAEYNGIFQVTVTGASTFTFAVTGTPVSPATGTIKYVKQSSVTSFTYDDEFNTKPFPTEADFDGLPLHQITQHERRGYGALTFTSLTNFATVATLTVSSTAGISTGDYVEVSGADQAEYNGVQQVTVTGGTTMTYTVAGSPASPATGTIVAKHHGRVTQSAGTATVRLIGHGLHTGHYVEMSGCTPSDYNGVKQVTVPSHAVTSITRSSSTATVNTNSAHGLKTNDIVAITGATQTEYNVTAAVVTVTGNTTFTYSVTGTPATPATGSPAIWDQSHFTFAIDSGVAALATGDIKVKTPAHMIYRGTYSGSTARMYCKEHGFSVGQWVEVVNEDSAHTSWRFWGPVTAISTDEYFEITASGVATTDIGHGQNDTDNAFWANRVIGIRKPMQELQTAIAGLLTADTDPGDIRFVEDSSPYETNYTLANLLGAGSFGSSWLSLMGRSVETVSDPLMQMQDALDLLVVMTVVGECTISSVEKQYSIDRDTYNPITIADDGGDIDVSFAGHPHLLSSGDDVYVDIGNPSAISPIPGGGRFRSVITVDSTTQYQIADSGSFVPGGAATSENYALPFATIEAIWDRLVGDASIPSDTSSTGNLSKRRAIKKFTAHISSGGLHTYYHTYAMTLKYTASATFTITPTLGDLVSGLVLLYADHDGDVSQDSYDVTDDDGSTYTLDQTHGTTANLISESKSSDFFETTSKVVVFTSATPGTCPLPTLADGSLTADGEDTQRRLYPSGTAWKLTRELVPGTHLTYG